MGVVTLAFTGMMVGFNEPNLVRFLIERLPPNAFGERMKTAAQESGLYREKKDNSREKKDNNRNRKKSS